MTIYLDNAATTAADPHVRKVIDRYLTKQYANPSSVHVMGEEAKAALERAREVIARTIGANIREVIFTGSGTEANNLALKGSFFAHGMEKNHIITTAIEHDCVLNACKWLEARGAEVTFLPVDGEGFVDPQKVAAAITDRTLLVSIIHGNNEIGTIQNLRAISVVCRDRGVLFHADACQSFTKVPIDVAADGLDLLTINAHKIYGPKGVGGLYIRKGTRIQPLLHGGGQEFGLRSSTENIPGIVGFATAASLASERDIMRMRVLRDWFLGEVSRWDGVRVNGSIKDRRLCNNINISFSMIEGELVRDQLSKRGICVSTGSACSSSSTKVSHVMKAIGCPMEYLHGNVRFSLSKWTTRRELRRTLDTLRDIVDANRMHAL